MATKPRVHLTAMLLAALVASSCSESASRIAAPLQHSAARDRAATDSIVLRNLGAANQLLITDAPPVALFGGSCSFDSASCTFDASFSSDDIGIVSYAWSLDRNPGGTASGIVTNVTYPHSGYRNVSLTVTDTRGQQSSFTMRVQVGSPPGVPPVGSFGYNCVGLTCSFPSSAYGSSAVVRSWDFGDGVTAGDVANPAHTYAVAGTYIATMRVVDGLGLSHTWATAVEVPYPTDFSPSMTFGTSCPSLACSFFGNASGNQPISVKWTFGDGETAGNVMQPSHTYAAPGTYIVTLTGTDAKGQSRTYAYALKVMARWPANPPSASFTSSCSALSCTLDASRSTAEGGIVSYSWDLNKSPGGSATGSSVIATYPHSGSRTVRLTVTDASGQTSSATQTLTIPD